MIPDPTSTENLQTPADPELPALLGGKPLCPEGPPPWPPQDPDILAVFQQAYADSSWGKYHGPWCRQLEERLAAYHGVEFAAVCCSGTFAVELALRSLPVKPGDEVIMAGYDFAGNFSAILAAGARPVLVDVDPQSWHVDLGRLEEAISPATRAMVVSHLHGGFVPMTRVMAIAQRHGLRVVEDAAQMPGGCIEGRRAGTWGDVGILSFGGSKLLSAGRGGAILTRHADIHHRAKLFCNRGNHAFPLSEIQAALLLPQLEKLDERNARRADNVRHLLHVLANFPGLRPLSNPPAGDPPACLTQPGYYKLGFQYDPAAFDGLPRDRFVEALQAEGIAFSPGFRSLAARSASRCRKAGDLPESHRAHEHMIVLHHPILLGSYDDLNQIALAVQKLYQQSPALQGRRIRGDHR